MHNVAYIMDRGQWDAANRAERNFWFAYIEDLCDQLGMSARAIEPETLGDAAALGQCSHLFVGPAGGDTLADAGCVLNQWVESGGILIGFACKGLDELFGVKHQAAIGQPIDDFTLNGSFDLLPTAVASDVHSPLHPSQRLLIVSNVRGIAPAGAAPIGQYYYANGRRSPFAAVTQRRLGSGWAFYFAFDVTQTLWALHQGRPVDRDYDGDGYFRVGDARVIGPNEEEVAYADEIVLLIQNMMARRPIPFVCAAPPADGQAPDALLVWGGDDEGLPELQLIASDFMAERGLPYHMNIMPRNDGTFALSREEAERIWANGHEIAVHFNYITDRKPPCAFTRDDVLRQAQLFHDAFGRLSECSVNHWCSWVGWAEPAKWMAEAGGAADNSRIHSATPPLNPTNQVGFSFGTAFPFYFRDDWRGGNARIDFLSEPITAYEVGYVSDKRTDPDMVHRAIDLAARYRMTMDMFYHPCNIARYAPCRAAIDEALSYIRRRGLRVKHMGNDELARWWRTRSASEAADFAIEDGQVAFTARTEHADGMVVKVPLGDRAVARCDAVENIFEYGQNWAYVVAPPGETRVEFRLENG